MSRSQFLIAQAVVLVGAVLSAWFTNSFGLGARNLEYQTSSRAPLVSLQNDLGKRLSMKYKEQTLKEFSAVDVDITNPTGRDTKSITLRFGLSAMAAGQEYELLEPYVLMPARLGDGGYQRLDDPEPGVIAFKFDNIKQAGAEDYRYTVRFLFSGPNAARIVPSTSEVDWDIQQPPWYRGPNRLVYLGMFFYVGLIVVGVWSLSTSSKRRPYASAERLWKSLKQRQPEWKLSDDQIEEVIKDYLEPPTVKPGWFLLNRAKVAQMLARLRSGGS